MNLEKIGNFIAEQRAQKKLTQKELADRLNVTNKAVSKWENGRSLPDVGLFDNLCTELDISLNELLSGEKDNKKEKKDKATMEFLRHFKKKNKFLLLASIISIILILFISGLFIYFINNYNKIKVYSLSGESENFIYSEGLFIDTNQEYFYTFGSLEQNNSTLDLKPLKISLKSGDELLFEDLYRSGGYLSETRGYNEIFTDEKVRKLDDWILEVTYFDNGSKIEKTEIIKLNNELKLINNNFLPKKVKSIGNDTLNTNVTSSLTEDRKETLESLKDYLVKKDYILDDEDNYIKKTDNGTYSITIDPYVSHPVTYKDDTYIVQFDPFYQTYNFIEKSSYGYIVSYVRLNESIGCYLECPLDMKETINEYIEMFDKEFNEIVPPKDSWMRLVDLKSK